MLDLSGKIFPFIGAIATVTLTAIAQTCLKLGMNSFTVSNESAENKTRSILQYSIDILTNSYVMAGLVGYLLSTLLWLYVLSRLPLSTAYPFVGLSIVFTSMFGVYYLNEPNSLAKLFGILLVGAGVVLVAKG